MICSQRLPSQLFYAILVLSTNFVEPVVPALNPRAQNLGASISRRQANLKTLDIGAMMSCQFQSGSEEHQLVEVYSITTFSLTTDVPLKVEARFETFPLANSFFSSSNWYFLRVHSRSDEFKYVRVRVDSASTEFVGLMS